MRFLNQHYYVGLLSAAAFHGAAQREASIFQLVTDRPTRDSISSGVKIKFHASSHEIPVPVQVVSTETGTMLISTPEVTAFDLIRFMNSVGPVHQVATVLVELSEKLNANLLAKIAPLYSVSEAQRLGYILEHAGKSEVIAPLKEWILKRRKRAVPLVTGKVVGQFGHLEPNTWSVR